eukprot:350214-Chlamydomonas_euryale.AAC.2
MHAPSMPRQHSSLVTNSSPWPPLPIQLLRLRQQSQNGRAHSTEQPRLQGHGGLAMSFPVCSLSAALRHVASSATSASQLSTAGCAFLLSLFSARSSCCLRSDPPPDLRGAPGLETHVGVGAACRAASDGQAVAVAFGRLRRRCNRGRFGAVAPT